MKKKIIEIFNRFSEQNPDPKTELNYVNEYSLLVAVVLSAQATDVSVNKATEELFKIASTPEDMIKLGVDELMNHIKTIGLYKQKAKNVIALSNDLINLHSSKVPILFEDLIKLPGVGRKTANVVLNVLYNVPTIPVDTHVFRVSKRLGLAKGNNVEKVEEELRKVIPKQFLSKSHHWLILHGRYVCKAQKPKCSECILQDICPKIGIVTT